VSNYVLNNRGNFNLKFFRRFKDISVFVVGSLILPHPVDTASYHVQKVLDDMVCISSGVEPWVWLFFE